MKLRAVALAVACATGATRGTQAQRCDLKPGHPLVTRAIALLRSAGETAFQDERDKDLRDALQQLTNVLGLAAQAKNAAAWYYLGRYYVATSDLLGADSAFRQTVVLAPGCEDEVNTWRRVLWVPVVNAGVAAWQGGNLDSALTAFRSANAVYTAEPTAFAYMAAILAARDDLDSAAAYFQLALTAAADPRFTPERKNAMYNMARVYQRAGRYDDAARAYSRYLDDYPADISARASVVAVYLETGQSDSAAAGVAALLADSDSAEAGDLISGGEEIYRAVPAPPDTAVVAACAVDASDALARCDTTTREALAAYDTARVQASRLALAVVRAGLAKNPWDRTALFTATDIAVVAGDTRFADSAAARLFSLDPGNRATLLLVSQAWRAAGNADSAGHYATLADSLPLDVTVGTLSVSPEGATLSGVVTNREPHGVGSTALGFDFLDRAGAVITSATQCLPALEAGESSPFAVNGAGEGIAAWRYRVGAP
ncbi:MAG TPA: tetratricopeptide repeat protein [Gemmatimonadales bacterium]|nr:tetratricopeptide repeat protein [Gemmatimonadales bacterium]